MDSPHWLKNHFNIAFNNPLSRLLLQLQGIQNFQIDKVLKTRIFNFKRNPFHKLSKLTAESEFAFLSKPSRTLHPDITSALGIIHSILKEHENTWKLFNRTKEMHAKEIAKFSGFISGQQEMELSGSHKVGRCSTIETTLKGTVIRLTELRLHISNTVFKRGTRIHNDSKWETPELNISADFATDVIQNHRISFETEFGNCNENIEGHSVSMIFSKTLNSRNSSDLSWGLAGNHRINRHLILFSRYSDANATKKIMLQGVYNFDDKNKISPIVAFVIGRQFQLGVTCKHSLLSLSSKSKSSNETENRNKNDNDDDDDENLQFRLLFAQNGGFLINFNYKIGEIM